MDEKRLAEIRAREAAATKGPWHVNRYDEDGGSINWQVQQEPKPYEVIANIDDDEPKGARHDAAFIAHAREDIPDLLAAVERSGPGWRAIVSIEECEGAVIVGTRPTLIEARAFADGFESWVQSECSGHAVFVLPDDESKLREDEEIDEERAADALRWAKEAIAEAGAAQDVTGTEKGEGAN